MYNIIYIFIVILNIVMILMLVNFLFSMKKMMNREKKSSYECGFESFLCSRLPFSMHFFLISLIFLVFDIELSILIPFIFVLNLNLFDYLSLIFYFIYILMFILGLFVEWVDDSMEWLI